MATALFLLRCRAAHAYPHTLRSTIRLEPEKLEWTALISMGLAAAFDVNFGQGPVGM